MKYVSLLLVAIMFVSCSPKFEVVKSNDNSIADLSKSEVLVGNNNTLSTPTLDISFNPYVEKDKQSQKVNTIGFVLYSKVNKEYVFGKINEVEFEYGTNQIIKTKVSDYSSEVYMYERDGSQILTNNVIENCILKLNETDFLKIINSDNLSIYIKGEKRNFTFTNDDISEKFKSNLRNFYNSYIVSN